MADIPQVERQLYILHLLSTNKWQTIEDIITNLKVIGIEISKKTVERDLDYISLNFFVIEDKVNNKNVYRADKLNIDSFSFTPAEVLSLYFMKEVMKSYSTLSIGGLANDLLENIINNTPQVNKTYLEALGEMVRVNNSSIAIDDNINEEHLEFLKMSIADKKSVELEYFSFSKGEILKRIYRPYLLEIKNGCWYAIGYCESKNDIRELRVSSITNIAITNKVFQKPDNFYNLYKQEKFNKETGQGLFQMKLKFKGNAANFIKEYEKEKADNYYFEKDYLIFEREVALEIDLERWILSFGPQVEVMEPEFLRNRIGDYYSDATNMYN